ncbi:MAG: HD domain-containing protein [Oscillospiraceae bacterium]|jgi:uncharacterized protein|nr:HD domain-containing protein [Oscillospiraceae bacterium]
MNSVVEAIREIVLNHCEQHKKNEKFGFYDYWNDHIKRVVHHTAVLAKEYGADEEIAALAALLHDVSMPAEFGDRGEHHRFSAKMTETLLGGLRYPPDRIQRVRDCVFNHPNSNRHLRTTIEETCIADADALAHFDRIPSLFSLAYRILGMGLDEGREYVKERLYGDLWCLSERTKEVYGQKLKGFLESLFVD